MRLPLKSQDIAEKAIQGIYASRIAKFLAALFVGSVLGHILFACMSLARSTPELALMAGILTVAIFGIIRIGSRK